MDSDLGAKVKKLRIAHGLTQEDVAKALEVTPGYISFFCKHNHVFLYR